MTTKQVQHLLAYLGYDVAPDGIRGPRTESAVRNFQKAHNLEGDGIPGPLTQRALRASVAREEEPRETSFWEEIPYFRREEFACTCAGRYCGGFPVEPEEALVRAVNAIRQRFGVPIRPSSAIRCPQRNREVGGVADSQHLTGRAADITVPGVSPEAVAAYAEELLPDTGGIGIYDWGIHLDTRAARARWRG